MGNENDSHNACFNNSDIMNSYSSNQNSNFLSLYLSKPSSIESNKGRREEPPQINIDNNKENFSTRDISNDIKELNKDGININTKNDNPDKKFICKKKGRPRKGQENQSNRNHTKDSYDNARKKIINSCKSEIYKTIKKYLSKNSNIKLHVPTIEKQMGYSYESIEQFFDKKIYDIFCDSKPKKLKDEIKNNREQYQHNTININKLLEDELKDENKQIKILNGLFNLYFKDFLAVYLNGKTEIKIFDDINISLDGFETYDSCFKDIYDQNLRDKFKTKILEMLNNNQY